MVPNEVRKARWVSLVAAATVLAGLWAIHAQESAAPLPDREPFLREVLKKLQTDDALLGQYTFTEREVQEQDDGNGKASGRTEKTYEVYPMPDSAPSYRRLIASNGVATPPRELAEADKKHREKVMEWAHARQNESPADRATREQKEAQQRQEDARMLEEVLRIFDIHLVGRQTVRGRPTIAVTFAPRPGVRPAIKDLAMLTKIRGHGLVDERDHEVVSIDLETTDTISFGLGLLARVYKGTTVSVERLKINDEVWLPMRMTLRPHARIALFKRYDTATIREYRDYRKFTVETATSFTLPKVEK